MRRILILVAAVMISLPFTINAQNDNVIGKQNIRVSSRMMTPEVMWAMGRIGNVAASPDGLHVAFQVGYYSVKQNKSHQVLCVMNADGSNRRQLTTSSKSETDPTWLDNQTIAFITDGEVWSMNIDGSGRRQLSQTDGQVEGFKYAPNYKHVIIIKSLPFDRIIKKRPDDLPQSTGMVITDAMFRHWDHYVTSIQHPFLAAVSTDGQISSEQTDILEGLPFECPMEPFGGVEQLSWSPDSKTIAYTCRTRTGLAYSISTDSDIFLYEVESSSALSARNLCKPGKNMSDAVTDAEAYLNNINPAKTLSAQHVNRPENVAQNNPGYDQNPQFSPDGRYVAWQSMARDGYEADLNRLCIYDLQSGNKRYINWKSDVEAFCWALPTATGKRAKVNDAQLYFLSVWHGCNNMYAVSQNGEVTQLTETWDDWTSLQMANNGQCILATRQSMSAPTDIYMVTPAKGKQNTQIQQISFENKHILDQLSFGNVRQYWVSTTDGGKELVWVILPAGFEEGKRYPTLLFCEGGPQSPVSQFWSYRWNFQIMAANGYVIVAPNRHGLPGFGQEWKEQISGDWTGQCMDDYLSAIDFAADSLPFVDRDHLGAVGASFGGFSVYYLAGHHDKRFKCFIAHDGAFNLEAMYTETEENWFSNWEYDDAYWNRDRTARADKTYKNSPHLSVDQWDTPILCIHGEKDYRINATQGMSAFNAARMRGIEAELLLYPDENHWVLKPQNGILWQRTFFEWLDRWLK